MSKFAAENTLLDLCKFLIDAGADKWSRTYVSIDQDVPMESEIGCLIRTPITAAADKAWHSEIEIEDTLNIPRLFEDCMDFSGRNDGWMVLWILFVNYHWNCNYLNGKYVRVLTRILRYFISEVKMEIENFDIGLLLSTLLGHPELDELTDILLSLIIDTAEDICGLILLRSIAFVPPQFLLNILKRRPNLHYSGIEAKMSPHSESPTSLSLYNFWTFNRWHQALRELLIDTEDFVKQELENSVLADAGWNIETLLVLFNYDFVPEYIYDPWKHTYCDICDIDMRYRTSPVQPCWMQKVERIEYGLNFDIERQHDEADDGSTGSEDMYDATSTWSNESGADENQRETSPIGRDLHLADHVPRNHKKCVDSQGPTTSGKDTVDYPSVTSDSRIFDRVYDRKMIVCIWCWERHKANGYRWVDQEDSASRDNYDSDSDFSPHLYQT